MTAIIGMLCSDGVVVGADSSATFGPHPQIKTVEQPIQKIEIVADRIILTGTGEIGLGQRFHRQVAIAWANVLFKEDPIEVCRKVCELTLADFATTQTEKNRYGAILAFPCAKKFHLCEFSPENFRPELKKPPPGLWWTSMGSGQQITDPFLALLRDSLWPTSQPNVREGTFATLWALEHAIDCNPGGINGPATLAVLQKEGGELKARLLSEADLAEHREAIQQAKSGLRTALKNLGSQQPGAVDLPKPTPGS